MVLDRLHLDSEEEDEILDVELDQSMEVEPSLNSSFSGVHASSFSQTPVTPGHTPSQTPVHTPSLARQQSELIGLSTAAEKLQGTLMRSQSVQVVGSAPKDMPVTNAESASAGVKQRGGVKGVTAERPVKKRLVVLCE